MNEESIKEKLNDLYNQINEANISYYNKNKPTLTDSNYDNIKLEFENLLNQSIEKQYLDSALIDKYESLLNKVGETPYKLKDENKHQNKMLSLDNAFSIDDVESFFQKAYKFLNLKSSTNINILCSYKVDGLSLSLTYKNKKLIKALTRGDGEYGEDVLHNVNFIKTIPKEVSIADEFEVRGEVYIENADFLQINSKLPINKQFKTPRNLASGTLRALDSKLLLERPLKFLPWHTNLSTKENTLSSRISFLKSLNFQEIPFEITNTISGINSYYNNINLIRSNIPYDIDGLVYKIDDINLQERLGNTIKSPRWAIAHKFTAQTGVTKLNKIILQVGRTGVVTPVADLTPINIGGVLITKATLHNLDEIARLQIKEGCLVELKRAGDVIPKIIQVIKNQDYNNLKDYQIPSKCPFCNNNLIKAEEEVALICSGGKNCPQILINTLKHFVSKNALNIEGLGEKTIELFYEKKFIQNKVDIFKLSDKKIEILNLEGFQEKSYNNIIESINKSKNTTLSTLIYSLGIKHIGEQASKLLSNFFITTEKLIHFLEKDIYQNTFNLEIVNISGLGEVTLNSFYHYFQDKENYQEFKNLLNYLSIFKEDTQSNSNQNTKVYNKTFLFTGTLTISRQEAKSKVEKQGGKVLSSISKSLDYLVAGENAGSKLKKAQDINIKILTEEEFNKLINHTRLTLITKN